MLVWWIGIANNYDVIFRIIRYIRVNAFDLNQLRTFVAVAETGSFTAAAPKVFLSQSSISEQMGKLEERAGVALMVRGKSGAVLTPAGERLLVHARRILALSAEAVLDLRGQALRGELRLGITDYFLPGDVAGILRRLNDAYPGVRLYVTITNSGALERDYRAGAFDVGLSMRIVDGAGDKTRGRLLRREPLVWAGARGFRLEKSKPLQLLLLPDRCALHRFVVRLLSRRNVRYTVAHVASGVAGLQLAVAAGLGVACLNVSSIGSGVEVLSGQGVLPALPKAEFRLLPARANESSFVTRMRDTLAEQFA